jgi:hypothetical protein
MHGCRGSLGCRDSGFVQSPESHYYRDPVYIISDQVLEHVEGNPQDVFDESLRLLKPGGVAVHTTCFINPVHGFPSDYWRFTPEGLKFLARGFSEILSVGGFGNRAVWFVSALGLRTIPVPHAKWHPLHIVATMNNKDWPVVTWIVARKGQAGGGRSNIKSKSSPLPL